MPNNKPLVTVICICYNQERFVKQAIHSILEQDYPNIELIIVDDCSTDKSKEIIKESIIGKADIKFIPNASNLGNCKSFNEACKVAKGNFIIDLAADDELLNDRISEGVKAFMHKDASYGVHYGDALFIDEENHVIGHHVNTSNLHLMVEGDLYKALMQRYFVCGPTMMIKKTVLDELGGYDEKLSYEDFDFWMRSSRKFHYCFTDKPLVRRRLHAGNYSKTQYKFGSPQMRSTYEVCKKIFAMNKNKPEDRALSNRILYEGIQCVVHFNLKLLLDYLRLRLKIFLRGGFAKKS